MISSLVWRSSVVMGALVLLSAQAAYAHGPCNCTFPALGRAGTTVTAGTPAIRVVFNPRRGDLGIAPAYLASAYAPDAPTTTLLSRPTRDPQRRARFRIPVGTPPGLYLVLIFDGSEGGTHNTWDLFHVIGRARHAAIAATGDVPDDSRGPWWIAGAGGLLLGLAIWFIRRRRGVSSSSRPKN